MLDSQCPRLDAQWIPIEWIMNEESYCSHLCLNVNKFKIGMKKGEKMKLLNDWKWGKGELGHQDTSDEFKDCPLIIEALPNKWGLMQT